MKHPNILILDIETAPVIGAVWSLWNNNLGLEQIKDDWFIMSFAAKWLGEEGVIYKDSGGKKNIENDKHLLSQLWKLLDKADIVVAHNGIKFDIKKINARFILNGFTPPSPYKIVDTLAIAKRSFAFTSNKLAYLTDKLCVTKKRSHSKFPGYTLWKECLLGNKEAWEEMRVYNIDDVLSLEELYLKIRAWDTSAPNLGAYTQSEEHTCPKCGGNHLIRKGWRMTQVGKYARFLCKDCGGWSAARFTQMAKEVSKNLLKPL